VYRTERTQELAALRLCHPSVRQRVDELGLELRSFADVAVAPTG